MGRLLGKIFDKITEFIARDLIYICSGLWIMALFWGVIVYEARTVTAFKSVFGELSWFQLVVIAPFAHVLGFAAREMCCILEICTSSILDPVEAFKDKTKTSKRLVVLLEFSFRKYILNSNAPPISEERDVVDTPQIKLTDPGTYRGTGIKDYVADFGDSGFLMDYAFLNLRSDFRTFSLYQRAIFLKESSGTFCGTMVSFAFIFLASTLQTAFDGGEWAYIGFAALGCAVLGLAVGKVSYFQALRQGHYFTIIARNTNLLRELAKDMTTSSKATSRRRAQKIVRES